MEKWKEHFSQNIRAGEIEKSREAVKAGFDPSWGECQILQKLSDEGYSIDIQLKAFRFLLLECELDYNCPNGHRALFKLIDSMRYDVAKIFIQAGLSLNDESSIYDHKSGFGTYNLFTHYIVENNPGTEKIAFMVENGADVTSVNQRALHNLIAKRKYSQAKILLENGANMNLICSKEMGGRSFPFACMFTILSDLIADKASEQQVNGGIDFMFSNGLDLTANDFLFLEQMKKFPEPENVKYIDLLYAKLEKKLQSETDQLSPELTEIFKKVSEQSSEIYLNADVLLKKSDNGYRFIDYLAAHGQLMTAFDSVIWGGREDEALSIIPQILPKYQSVNISTPLKIQKMQKLSRSVKRPLKR